MTHVFEGEFVHQNLGRIRKEFRVDQMCEWETRKAAVRGLFFCEHGIVIDTCEELDHLGEQAMQYLNITLREKDTQVIPFCADGTYWVPVEAGEAKDVRAEKWMEYYQCDQERFWKFQRRNSEEVRVKCEAGKNAVRRNVFCSQSGGRRSESGSHASGDKRTL